MTRCVFGITIVLADVEMPVLGRKRLAATKLYWDKMLVNVAQGGADDRLLGPAVYLPKQRHLIGLQNGNKTE